MNMMALLLLSGLVLIAVGGAGYVVLGMQGVRTQKRIAAVARSTQTATLAARTGSDTQQQRRKNVSVLLKDLEKQQQAKKQRPTLRRRIEQAGLTITPRQFYIMSGAAAAVVFAIALAAKFSLLVAVLAAFASGVGLPRWTLGYLKGRRQRKFTEEFANAIDVIVRSVKSGLPVNEALKIVAREMPEPVCSEFDMLVESLKVGVTLEQGCKRMLERMPTAEVNFFSIVMTIQLKSGGNLSEALSNLSGVLRDRKRLKGKIKAMSSEAKASAGIIGSLPPGVALMVYLTSPNYIMPLFVTRTGNLLLALVAVWMGVGIFVMQRMISFKH